MTWEDRYFEAPPSRTRLLFAVGGIVFVLVGLLLGMMAMFGNSRWSAMATAVDATVAVGLTLYGFDLVVRAIHPIAPGRTFAGTSGALRLIGISALSSTLIGTGVFGLARGVIGSGVLLAACGLLGLCGVLVARARRPV